MYDERTVEVIDYFAGGNDPVMFSRSFTQYNGHCIANAEVNFFWKSNHCTVNLRENKVSPPQWRAKQIMPDSGCILGLFLHVLAAKTMRRTATGTLNICRRNGHIAAVSQFKPRQS
jgi:hypothetical protein